MQYMKILMLAGFLLLAITPEMAQAQSAKLRKVTQEIAEVEQKATELAQQIAALQKTEAEIRQRSVREYRQFAANLQAWHQINQQPPATILTPKDFVAAYEREALQNYVTSALQGQIARQYSSLDEVLDMSRDQYKLLAELKQMHKKLQKQRSYLGNRLLSSNSGISPAARTKLLRQARRWKKEGSLDDIFINEGVDISELIPLDDTQAKLPGQIVQKFGTAQQTGLATQGIQLQSLPGSNVPAVQAGRVVFAGRFAELDQLVILQHANGYHSVYGGLQDGQSVQVGQMLEAGESVGQMPLVLKPMLYFEVRKDGQPINPQAWLQGVSRHG